MSGGHQRLKTPDVRFYVCTPTMMSVHIRPYTGQTSMPDMTHTPPIGGVMSGMSGLVERFLGVVEPVRLRWAGGKPHRQTIHSDCGYQRGRPRYNQAAHATVALALIGGHCCAAFAWPFIDIIGLFRVFAYKLHCVQSCCTAAWQAKPLILLGCAAACN